MLLRHRATGDQQAFTLVLQIQRATKLEFWSPVCGTCIRHCEVAQLEKLAVRWFDGALLFLHKPRRRFLKLHGRLRQ